MTQLSGASMRVFFSQTYVRVSWILLTMSRTQGPNKKQRQQPQQQPQKSGCAFSPTRKPVHYPPYENIQHIRLCSSIMNISTNKCLLIIFQFYELGGSQKSHRHGVENKRTCLCQGWIEAQKIWRQYSHLHIIVIRSETISIPKQTFVPLSFFLPLFYFSLFVENENENFGSSSL